MTPALDYLYMNITELNNPIDVNNIVCYKGLLNVTFDTINKWIVTQQFKCCKIDDFTMSPLDVKEAGLDNLTSEHFK